MARIGIADILVICALATGIGLPIWFAVRARPLGKHPYRWGTWIAFQCALVYAGIALFAALATIVRGIDIPLAFFWLTGITSLGGAIGLFRRMRVGAVLAIVSEIFILLLDPVTRAFYVIDEPVPNVYVENGLAILGLVAINVFYFKRRWAAMGRQPVPVANSV